MLQKFQIKGWTLVLPGLCLRLPNSVKSPLFSNLYICLKSMNALNINFFLLPTKLLPLLNLLIRTAWSLLSPHLLSSSLKSQPSRSVKKSPVAHFAMHHLISGTSCLIPPALYKTLSWWCHTHKFTSHLLSAHHSHPPSHIHCFIPGSKLTFSTNLFHHSLLAPTWIAFLDYWTGLTRLNGFSFLVIYFFYFFILDRAVD